MIPEKVKKVLDEHGLQAVEFEEGSTPTSVLAARKLGVEVGQIAKSLLFMGKNQRFHLVVCQGDRKVSPSKLKAVTGTKTRLANGEETLSATGFELGGVCPFGIEGIAVLIDEHLKAYTVIYPAAGTNASGVPMTFEQLVSITGGRVYDLTVPMGQES